MRLFGFSGYLPLSSHHRLYTHTTLPGKQIRCRVYLCVVWEAGQPQLCRQIRQNLLRFWIHAKTQHWSFRRLIPYRCFKVCMFSLRFDGKKNTWPASAPSGHLVLNKPSAGAVRYARESTAKIRSLCLNIRNINHFLRNKISGEHPN